MSSLPKPLGQPPRSFDFSAIAQLLRRLEAFFCESLQPS